MLWPEGFSIALQSFIEHTSNNGYESKNPLLKFSLSLIISLITQITRWKKQYITCIKVISQISFTNNKNTFLKKLQIGQEFLILLNYVMNFIIRSIKYAWSLCLKFATLKRVIENFFTSWARTSRLSDLFPTLIDCDVEVNKSTWILEYRDGVCPLYEILKFFFTSICNLYISIIFIWETLKYRWC